MRIKTMGEGPFVDFSINDCVVEFDGGVITLDCRSLQTDSELRMNVFSTPNGLALGKGDNYVASIIIPPKRYEEVKTGEKDEQGNEILEKQEVPLDSSQIVLILWPYIK